MFNDVTHQGFLGQSTRAFTAERVPRGLLVQAIWTRASARLGQRATRQQRPRTDKESQQWLTSLGAVIAAHTRCPTTRFIRGGDRAADVDERCLVERSVGVDWLVRAAWDRGVDAP